MSTFIDRDPEKMAFYAKNAEDVINDMNNIIRKVQGVLDVYKKDLDDPTIKQIEFLTTCCNAYFKEIAVYQKVAQEISRNAKRLADIRNGG